jgi:FADH2 O2-dependent halogenase
MVNPDFDVAVVGGGFGGTLLARTLASRGWSVVLVEQGHHPRFRIGESSTPLGNLAMERLSRRYGLTDLKELSSHGRWVRSHPELGRGLKRGFTFYRHRAGEPYANGASNDARLLVAASPSDAVADTHWLRADVDRFWWQRAEAEGVDCRDETTLLDAEERADGVRLKLSNPDGPAQLTAAFAVDATGPAGALAEALGVAPDPRGFGTVSAFVGTHFTGVPPFREIASEAGACLGPGPYPDDWAAAHHLLDEGWLYMLRFDDGRVSAGVLLEGQHEVAADPSSVFETVVGRYPSLRACFTDARHVERWLHASRLQHRRQRASGERWALLPHTYAFVDPLFSTGIAWTLLGVERLAEVIEAVLRETTEGGPSPLLARYAAVLSAEADQIDRLVRGAYEARHDFRLTSAHAQLYFAAVSWAESVQRLRPSEDDHWQGFLGVGDPALAHLPAEALARLQADTSADVFERWVADAIARRNVAGLADSTKANLYPADPEDLVRGAARLGLSPEAVRERLPALLRI